MKFKLTEKYDETREFVQEYIYDAIDELGSVSLDEYLQWFASELTYFDDIIKQVVTDTYIEAIDYGMLKGLSKTMITSELTTYLESNSDLLDTDINELINNCPDHLKHELILVLVKIEDSLSEELLTESMLEESIRPDLKTFIEQNAELLDENNIEELYKQCPRELKIPLVRVLNAASLSDNIQSIKRATFLADFYDDDELINLVLSVGEHANDVFDAFDYIMNNWEEFFTDDILNETLLTERTSRKQIEKILTFITQQMSLNNSDCISSADIRKIATQNPQANFINQKTSQELMRIINDSDSGLEATIIDSNTNTFMIYRV